MTARNPLRRWPANESDSCTKTARIACSHLSNRDPKELDVSAKRLRKRPNSKKCSVPMSGPSHHAMTTGIYSLLHTF